MPVNIITFDGTASLSPTNFEISEAMNPDPTLTPAQRRLGGGFPANVAIRLQQQQPNYWNWIPIDYKPGFRLQSLIDIPGTVFVGSNTYDVPFRTGSMGRALGMLAAKLQAVSGPIVLCGLSQGGWICDTAYMEFVNPAGMFHSRLNDLKAVVTFGSLRRPQAHTIPLPGAVRPLGQGVADFAHDQSYGSSQGLIANPPTMMWSFSQMDDAASDGSTDTATRDAVKAVAEFLWDGDTTAGFSLLGQLGPLVTQLVGALTWNSIKPNEPNPHAISKWLPFFGGNADPRVGNPHAHYNSYAYDMLITSPIVANTQYRGVYNPNTNVPALSNSTGTAGHLYKVSAAGTRNFGAGNLSLAADDYLIHASGTWQKAVKNTKTAVDLAVDYLLTLGSQYATEPVVATPNLGFTWWQTPPD